jgi:Ricin-type beta-trefoil lectin domain-like
MSLRQGVYTVQQKINDRFLDAWESPDRDFAVVTRDPQNNDSQRWVFMPLGNDTYTIQQLSNGRFMDAHEVSDRDFAVVTREPQNNDSQRWAIKPS